MYKLRPSAADRWTVCHGSERLIAKQNVTEKSQLYTHEGTVAHMLCETALSKRIDPSEFLNNVYLSGGFKIVADQEMIDAVKVYVDYILNDIVRNYKKERVYFIESYASLEPMGVGGLKGGTADFKSINREYKIIHIVDYKHGKGIAVEIEMNKQLLLYALAALIKEDPRHTQKWRIVYTIVQPRAIHRNGPIRTSGMTSACLHQWFDDVIRPAAKSVNSVDAILHPSVTTCRFCTVSGDCTAQNANTLNALALDGNNMPIEPNLLTTAQKKFIMENLDMINGYLKKVKNKVHAEMHRGSTAYDGILKLVKKKSNRVINNYALDPDLSELLDHIEEAEFLTKVPRKLSEIERNLKKVLDKKDTVIVMKSITHKPDNGLTVASLKDTRKACSIDPAADFK